MSNETSQIHRPLTRTDNIRVLRLKPGRGDDPITTELEEQSRQPGKNYDAISYVWGATSDQRKIVCNGITVHVTSNLFAALKRLRYDADVRTLWVDALCINQADPVEKTHQVRQMREVYASSSRVVIWLGEEDKHGSISRAVILLYALVERFYRACGGQMHMLLREYQIKALPDWVDVRNQLLETVRPDDFSSEDWAALGELLRRPWFSRIWVVQEAVMAPSEPDFSPMVMCGSHYFHFDTLSNSLLGLRLLGIDYKLWEWLPKGSANRRT